MRSLEDISNWPNRSEAFYLLAEYYKNISPKEQAMIRKSWDFGQEWIFPNGYTLACQIPGEPAPEKRIEAALIYESIVDDRFDYRDQLVSLCIIYNSALSTKISPEYLFESVAKISSERTAKVLRDFINRRAEDKSLSAFGLEKVTNNSGEVEFRLSGL